MCGPPGQPDWLLEKKAAAAVVMLTLTASAVAPAAVPWTLIADAMAVVPLAAQLQQQKESAALVSEALLVQLRSLVQSLCQPLTAKESVSLDALLSAQLVSCGAILISLQQCLPLSP